MKEEKVTIATILMIVLSSINFTFAKDKILEYDGRWYRGEIEKSFEVREGSILTMQDIGGDVSVVAEERNDIYIAESFRIDARSESDADEILRDNKAKFTQRGNSIVVDGRDKSRRYSSDYWAKVPEKINIEIHTSGGDIDVSNVLGDVKLSASGGDIDIEGIEGKISARSSGGDVKVRKCGSDLSIETSGGDINISEAEGIFYVKTSGGDIFIRKMEGEGEIITSGGDIDLIEVNGREFIVRTSGGDIQASDINANMRLRTSGGDIIIDDISEKAFLHTSGGDIEVNLADGDLDAETSGGDIYVGEVTGYCNLYTSGGDIEIEKALSNMELKTSGGDIVVLRADGPVYAHTSGGDIEVRKKSKEEIDNHSVDLSTSGGDISISIPENMGAYIDARIEITDRWNRDCDIISDFPINIERTKKGSKIVVTGVGSINNGGDTIKLDTVNGNIVIRKEESER